MSKQWVKNIVAKADDRDGGFKFNSEEVDFVITYLDETHISFWSGLTGEIETHKLKDSKGETIIID